MGFRYCRCFLTCSGCMRVPRSMWRLVCIAFFGAFAWGAASEVYGPQIMSACQRALKAVTVRLVFCARSFQAFLQQTSSEGLVRCRNVGLRCI